MATGNDPGRLRRQALAAALSRVANASVEEALAFVAPNQTGGAWRTGVTGPPGSGKSTLIGRLAAEMLKRYPEQTEFGNERLAVLAIDPSSPRGQGAVLGDRVRMDAIAADPRLYIRSLASRGGPEGLAHNIADVISLADAYGFDDILIETVGIGQAECAIRILVDSLVVVLHPDAGDSIQAMKAGVHELADIYVVNKADIAGARRTAGELRAVLKASPGRLGWMPPVIEVSRDVAAGVEELDHLLMEHRKYLESCRDPLAVAAGRRRFLLRSLLQRRIDQLLDSCPEALAEDDLHACFAAVAALMPDKRRCGRK